MPNGTLPRTAWPRNGNQLSTSTLQIDAMQNRPSIVGKVDRFKDDDGLLATGRYQLGHGEFGLSRPGCRWNRRENVLDTAERNDRTLCQADHPPQNGERSCQQPHIADERHKFTKG